MKVMPDDADLTVDAYNDLLDEIQTGASKIMEEQAGVKAALRSRKIKAQALGED